MIRTAKTAPYAIGESRFSNMTGMAGCGTVRVPHKWHWTGVRTANRQHIHTDRVARDCRCMWIVAVLVAIGCTVSAAAADRSEPPRIRLITPGASTWQTGVIVQGRGAPVTGIIATLPIPMNWPEQDVQQLSVDSSPSVGSIQFRELDHGVRQMIVTIPRLGANEQAQALVTLRITKKDIVAAEKTLDLRAPKRLAGALLKYTRPSPYIDSQDPKIRQLARQVVAGHPLAWEQVEAIYDWVRDRVEYRFAEQIKSSRQALDDGYGDCEELSSLIIAMCRDVKIPARLVWVPGHCYPEFYLEDQAGKGYWFPCQAAGTRSFGAISEARPILQKGDSFQVPGSRKKVRYVHETLTAKNAPIAPAVQFIRRQLDGAGTGSSEEKMKDK